MHIWRGMNWVERKAAAAERKRQLAEKIDSNELLIAALRFYLAILKPGRPVLASLVWARSKDLSRRVKTSLRAARRVLGIFFPKSVTGQLLIRLPENFTSRLRKIGLDLSDWDLRKRLEALNPNLIVDEPMKEFANSHPILEAVKAWLRTSAGPKPEAPPFEPDHYTTHVQNAFQANLANWRADRAL